MHKFNSVSARQDFIKTVGLKNVIFDKDLTPKNTKPTIRVRTQADARQWLHETLQYGLHRSSEEQSAQLHQKPDADIVFRQIGPLCSLFATWQLLFSGFWDELDNGTKNVLLCLVNAQNESPQYKMVDPPRQTIPERSEIMLTYANDREDERERRELIQQLGVLRSIQALEDEDIAVLMDRMNIENVEKGKEIESLQTELRSMDKEAEQSLKAVPWYGSFTRLLRAHLLCFHPPKDVTTLRSPDAPTEGDSSIDTPSAYEIQSGFNLISIPFDEDCVVPKSTWDSAVNIIENFDAHFKDNKKGYCVRAVLPDQEAYNHFITYIGGLWYDNGNGGIITKEFTELNHFQQKGTVTDLHIVIYKS